MQGRTWPGPLTAREIQILDLMGRGLSRLEMARVLSISPNTVQHHQRLIYLRLEAKNAPSAIAKGFRLGYLMLVGM